MDEETKDAMLKVIQYLNTIMAESPSREVADTHNCLQSLLEKEW